MSNTKNCALQYAYTDSGFMGRTVIVHDESELTMEEAKAIWSKYYPDAAKRIKNGDSVEMALWINMPNPQGYGETLHYINGDSESDGVNVWEVKKTMFPK